MAQGGSINWSAPEFHFYEKSAVWYWASGAVTVLILGIALSQRNFLFAIFVAVAGMMVIAWGRRVPRTVSWTLTEEGFTREGKLAYPFDQLAAFAVVPRPPNPAMAEIVLRPKNTLQQLVRIMVPKEQLEEVRQALRRAMKEFEFEETLTDYLFHLLRF